MCIRDRYQAYTDYKGMMDLTENLYRFVAQDVLGTTKIVYNGIEMDLGKPFERITMVDAVKKYSGVDFNEIHTLEEADVYKRQRLSLRWRAHSCGSRLSCFLAYPFFC